MWWSLNGHWWFISGSLIVHYVVVVIGHWWFISGSLIVHYVVVISNFAP